MSHSLKNIKGYFPWFKNNKHWTYLDSSASSLKPECVIKATTKFYETQCFNPHNTDSKVTRKLSLQIAEARTDIAKFFNADPEEIVFTSGATESLNIAINGLKPLLKKGNEVVMSYLEHASSMLPWINLAKSKKIKLQYAGGENKIPNVTDFVKLININTKVLSISNISNLIGSEISLPDLIGQARTINPDIIIILDATQSAPHMAIDVKALKIDFMVCSAHKMCGPTGIGLLYGKKEYLEQINPIKLGGGMNFDVTPADFKFSLLPDKFEGGTPNTAGILAWRKAISFLWKIGMNQISAHDFELKTYATQQLKKVKNIRIFESKSRIPVIAFNIKNIHPQDLANYLGDKKIIVRGGESCARLQKYITNTPQGFVRASFYLYNTKKDVDKLVIALNEFNPRYIVEKLV